MRAHASVGTISSHTDQMQGLGHKFCAILANRAGYCIELDSHKGFAA